MYTFYSAQFGRPVAHFVLATLAMAATAATAQVPKVQEKHAEPEVVAPGQRILTGEDAKRAEELEKAIDAARGATAGTRPSRGQMNFSRYGRRSRDQSTSRP